MNILRRTAAVLLSRALVVQGWVSFPVTSTGTTTSRTTSIVTTKRLCPLHSTPTPLDQQSSYNSSPEKHATASNNNNKNNNHNFENNTASTFKVNGSNGHYQPSIQQQQQQQSSSFSPAPKIAGWEDVLEVDPSDVVVRIPLNEEDEDDNDDNDAKSTRSKTSGLIKRIPFVNMFRGSANYIANHCNTLVVYHLPGGLLDLPDSTVFRDLMDDIALTWLLGMKVVIVVGCRHQMERCIKEENRHYGLRVTDEDTLRMVKEEAGYVRFEVERQLARSLRMQGGGQTSTTTVGSVTSSSSSTPSFTNSNGNNNGNGNNLNSKGHGYYEGNVVSGNFYSAQPFGILDGVDYKYTGFVRRVEVEKIRQLHSNRDICLLTTLGVSPSGEVFNVNSESLACIVAGALEASKVIFFTESAVELRHKVHGNKIQSLRVRDAKNLLKYTDISLHRKGFVTFGPRAPQLGHPEADLLISIGWGIEAVEQGVKRAHVISSKHGALLQELYTRDGSGVLISGDLYEGIRRATVHDVSGIHEIISPLIQAGTLIDRPKSTLEKDVDTYYVYTRDNHIVACGQLKIFEGGYAEIGCLVVNKDYRSRGRGDAMLGYLERLSLRNGCSRIFVLSTQTMEWFVERGFVPVPVSKLPPSRQETYNYKRASKIYMKEIESVRDLDASELWWNR